MIADIGYIALIVAFLVSSLQAISFINNRLNKNAFLLAEVSFLSLSISFGCLLYVFAESDFSVLIVAQNSHTAKPLIYKISGAWGNHEGSMLLFAWMLSIFTALFAFRNNPNSLLTRRVLPFQGFILASIISYIIFVSSPFMRLDPVPANGFGLNPLLQDIGLAFHPPMLYMGYVGFSLAISFSMAALIEGKVSKQWAASLRPWVTISWSFLTIGIGLGSWWAYRELGWGGFWFWDPVENSSLLPWLAGTALLHSLIVVQKRSILATWTVLLGILTFSLSLMGFFLVRSGLLTSVHAFASDPSRGLYLLALITFITGGGLVLYALRGHMLSSNKQFELVSKESTLVFNNIVLVTLCGTVLLGTLYPLLVDTFLSQNISVGAAYFNRVFNPIAVFALIIVAIAPFFNWKSDSLTKGKQEQKIPAITSAVVGLIVLYLQQGLTLVLPALMFSTWLAVGMIVYMRKFSKLTPHTLAMVTSHIGLALLVASIAISTTWQKEIEAYIKKGETISFSNYTILSNGVSLVRGKNYIARRGEFFISDKYGSIPALYPEVRVFPVEGTQTTEAAIHNGIWGNFYLVIGEDRQEGTAIRAYYQPMQNGIWLGCLLIALGGVISLWSQRRKV